MFFARICTARGSALGLGDAMGDDCAIIEISALRPLNGRGHISKNDAELWRGIHAAQTCIFPGVAPRELRIRLRRQCETPPASARNYAQIPQENAKVVEHVPCAHALG